MTLPHPHEATSLYSSTLAVRPEELQQQLGYHHRLQDQDRDEAAEILNFGSATSPIAMLPKKLFANNYGDSSSMASSSNTALLLPNTDIHIPNEEEVLEWAHRYTSVEALREHFGTNQNKLWGDLQASTARRLYKTLLPRALLELSKLGQIHPQDLAPLAYQARVAAKLYARERCTVPARIAATLFDGFRQWHRYGRFQAHGMTYDQLWEKYAEKILHETESSSQHHHHHHHHDAVFLHDSSDYEVDEECKHFDKEDCQDHYEEISEQVCRKILERACVSNEGVDALALRGQDLADETSLQPHQRQLLEHIRSQLEQDMYQLLLVAPPHYDDDDTSSSRDHNEHERPFHLAKGLAGQ